MKRFLSWLLILAMVTTMLPMISLAAAPVTVYMDPVNGSNENDGTEASPVQNFTTAYKFLQDGGGKVIMLSTVYYAGSVTLPTCRYPVTITSKTGAEGIRTGSNLIVSGETTFENMTFTHLKASTATMISGNGYKLTMGEGLNMIPHVEGGSSYYFCLQGGTVSGNAAATELIVKSGQYRNIYAGSNARTVDGNARLTMTGGKAAVVAASYSAAVNGDIEISLSGNAEVTTVYAGAWSKGNVKNVTVTLGEGATVTNLYSAGNGTGNVTATTVILDGYDQPLTVFKGAGGASHTGTLGSSTLVLKSGTLSAVPTDFGKVDVDIPAGKTLTLEAQLDADTLKSAGTLIFCGASGLTAQKVTDTVNCTIEGAVLRNQEYVKAPAGSAISFPADTGVVEKDGTWVNHDPANFAGLVLKASTAVTMKLYGGIFAQGTGTKYSVITPYMTETKDGCNYYYYPNIQGGYHVRASRSGYITLYKNIYMSAEEAAAKTVEEIVPEKKSADGFVPSTVYSHTTEVLENEAAWKSEGSMYPKYEGALDIPVFQSGRDAHQMTTQEELWADLHAQDQPDDNMYVFTLGKSGQYGYDIPLVIFTQTDLSSAKTMEQAAQLMNEDKLTVYYRAQMHGNEPGGGEGALAMIHYLQDGYAEKILDKLDVIIIPRLNVDGSQLYQRLLPNEINPNRDQMRIESAEMYAFQKGFLLFAPEIVLDGHERVWNNSKGDIQVTAAFTTMNSDAYRLLALTIDEMAFAELAANDLNGYYYSANVSGYDPNMGSGYYAATGTSMYVLMESRGIYGGNESMERRAVAHMAAVTGMLNYFYENDTLVKETIHAEGKRIAENGKTYRESNVFVLDTDSRKTNDQDQESWGILNTAGQVIDWGSGAVTFPLTYPSVDDVVVRSRVLPTAYAIGADCGNIQKILKMMDDHGISYTYLPAGATLPLQRYGGTGTEAFLTAERSVRFAEGCYVFPMNQVCGLLLAGFMEPDHTNSAEFFGNLVQMNLLGVADTYRYVRDLNTQGFVDYQITDAGFVDVTVYLDGTNGNDGNDGLTEATAVKTLAQAYAVLEQIMCGASRESQATIVVVGLYDLGAAQTHLPGASFHVTITGKTTADGFSFTGGSSQDLRTFELHGDTTLENMRLHVNNTQAYNFLVANGHKLVLGEGLNTTANKANCYFTVAGGAYGYTATCATTDLTIRSGSWRTVYAGGYRGSVTGAVKADISGCYVYQNIAPTYMGDIGSVEMTISNVEVDDAVATSAIYAAPIMYADNRGIGTVRGNVTLILGENIKARAVYMASRENGVVVGTVTVIPKGLDQKKVPILAQCDTTTGVVVERCIMLTEDLTEDTTWQSVVTMDLAGHNVTGTVTVDGPLKVKDSATDDFTVADGVYGKISGTITGGIQPAEGYMDINGESFHKLELGITGVAIRPSVNGMYYKATWRCDEVLAAQVKEFGIATSIVDMPGDSYEADADTIYTVIPGEQFVSGKAFTGAMITNVLKAGEDNDARGKMPVYAVCYITFQNDHKWVSAGVDLSLYEVMHLAEEFAYSEHLEDFYHTWEDTMNTWNFVRLGK